MDIQTVDFYDLESLGDFTFYKPVSLEFYGTTVEVRRWSLLLVNFVEQIYHHFPDKIDKLRNSQRTHLADLFADRKDSLRKGLPLRSLGGYLETNFSALNTLKQIKEIITYCNLNISKITVHYTNRVIEHTPKQTSRIRSSNSTLFKKNPNDSFVLSLREPSGVIPQSIQDVFITDYPNGFDFNSTTISLLEVKTGYCITEGEQIRLKKKMYRRCDDLYFLYDSIVDRQVRLQICEYVNVALENFHCFELNALYERFSSDFNLVCIRNLEDFEEWFFTVFDGDIKAANFCGGRIIRLKSMKLDAVIARLVRRIRFELKKSGGTLEEDKLLAIFDAFSIEFLDKLIRQETDDVIVAPINGRTSYQSFDALGIPEEFQEELYNVFEKIVSLELKPTLETINSLVSVALNFNFEKSYNIPNDKTFRKLIETFYKGAAREWKGGEFREIDE